MNGRTRQSGFTLVELLVVMGILTGFLTMLVQLVDSGLTMFRDGETSQVLADRSSAAQRVIVEELKRLRGSATGRDREGVDDRLVVQVLPLGLPYAAAPTAARAQVLRCAVHLAADRELLVIDQKLVAEVLAETPDATQEELAEAVAQLRTREPVRGVGNMMMLPWRQQGSDSLLELRVGWFLPGMKFPVGPERWVDPFQVIVPGSEDLPARLVYDLTEPILRDLLHVEFAFWGQRTTSWGDDKGALHGAPATARKIDAQPIWDSARGGWLVDADSGGEFVYDRGPISENDTSDDIHPHAILVRVVVAQPDNVAPEGLLVSSLSSDARELVLYDGTSFPGASDGGYVKVGNEWIRYAELDGDSLIGLQRGMRGTRPLEHESGARVHVGRTSQFVVPILHRKDDWNE